MKKHGGFNSLWLWKSPCFAGCRYRISGIGKPPFTRLWLLREKDLEFLSSLYRDLEHSRRIRGWGIFRKEQWRHFFTPKWGKDLNSWLRRENGRGKWQLKLSVFFWRNSCSGLTWICASGEEFALSSLVAWKIHVQKNNHILVFSKSLGAVLHTELFKVVQTLKTFHVFNSTLFHAHNGS